MINYDSILSAFDGKPTLLQWLKMVKKALDESVLKDVTIAKDGDNISFTFNFEDGTSVTTPKVTLPKGDKGNDGVSIVNFQTGSYIVSGNLTDTDIHAVFSNGENKKFVVHALNGKDANKYLHCVNLKNDSNENIYFNLYSKNINLTIEEALNQIPTLTNTDIYLSDTKIPVCYDCPSVIVGTAVAGKYESSGSYYIRIGGVLYNYVSGKVERTELSFSPTQIVDTLLGENL